MTRLAIPMLVLIVLGTAACDDRAAPQAAASSGPEDRIAEGRKWYGSHCATCHGPEGRGDGPVAPALSTPPADLTGIARRNDGVFDAAAVAAFIDGRDPVTAHGSPDMPVWGRELDDRREGGFRDETLLTRATIERIVDYLESIQEPANER